MSRLPQPGVLSLSASHCRAQAPYGTAVSGTACRGIASHKAEGLDPQRRAWLCSEGDWKLALAAEWLGPQALSQGLAAKLQAWAQVSRCGVAGSSAPGQVTWDGEEEETGCVLSGSRRTSSESSGSQGSSGFPG